MDKTSEHYKKYKAYIASPVFKVRKAWLIEKRGLACEGCPRPISDPSKLHTHHVTYDRLYNEIESDLLLLCPTCHKKAHSTGADMLVPEGMEVWLPGATFVKAYDNSWKYVRGQLTAIEIKAAHSLSMKIAPFTNSLSPLKETSRIEDWQEVFTVSRNKIKPILRKLMELGVCLTGKDKYLVLNPFLSFIGKEPKQELAELFKNTHVARAFRDPEYGTMKMSN